MSNEPVQDIKAAQQTYTGFTAVLKWSTIATAIAVAIVVLLIA